ncbi:MAG: MBL fold metallo-hydrolase, partial [Firmicutes bacterium]|nr:MBL fold metallo-hydrolase [Bacillota bacterium]
MSKKYEIKTWRSAVERKPEFGKVFDFEPTTKFFDQLSFVGDPAVCCFLLETAEGLVLIDAMDPEKRYMDAILKGISDIGYEITDLKHIVITHGHGDHYGLADELRKLSGAKIYISEGDHELAKHPAIGRFSAMDYPVDVYLTDGMDLKFGDTVIHCVETPGHTDHCMS